MKGIKLSQEVKDFPYFDISSGTGSYLFSGDWQPQNRNCEKFKAICPFIIEWIRCPILIIDRGMIPFLIK